MTDRTSPAPSLEDRVKALLGRQEDTRELTRAVASLLFHEFGEIPTSTRIHGLIRRGSLSTITSALKAFWLDLRQQTAFRLDLAQIPPEVVAIFSDGVAQAWRVATEQATAAAQAEMAEAKVELAKEQERALAAVEEAKHVAAATQERLAEVERELGGVRGELTGLMQERSALTAQADDLRRALDSAEAAVKDARDRLAAESAAAERRVSLANEQAARREAEHAKRSAAAAEEHKRQLLEIDRARTQEKEAQGALRKAHGEVAKLTQVTEKAYASLAALQEKINVQGDRITELRAALDESRLREKDLRSALSAEQARSSKELTELSKLLRRQTGRIKPASRSRQHAVANKGE
jgi:regulator of replication initiation timing